MSGLGLLQTPGLKFIPFEASRMYTWPSTKVGNGGFTMPRKCMEKTPVSAELHIAGLKRGQGQRLCPEILIPEISYVDEVVKKLSQNHDSFKKTQPDQQSCRIFCANQYTDKFVTSGYCKRGNGNCVCQELTAEEIPYVDEVVKRLSRNRNALRRIDPDLVHVEEAYESCRMFCAEREKWILSASRLLSEDRARGLLAIFAWGRRIDDLVDSLDDENIRSAYLDQWDEKTKDILNGCPQEILDVALADTISKFHMDPTPFEDVLKGMRMDITKNRYANFEELFLFCYYGAGTLGLMLVSVIGIAPESAVSCKVIYEGMLYIGIALQLTNILKDVSNDAQLGRVYLPQDELAQFNLCDEDIISKKVSDEWREFMKRQIQRAGFYYDLGKQGISQLDKTSLSKVMAILMMYRHILDEIEEKNYDNLTNKVSEMMF